MGTKIRVTKTIGGKEWLCFDESDVRKACVLAGCDAEMIAGCIANFREGKDDCVSCYINLINDLDAVPEYLGV